MCRKPVRRHKFLPQYLARMHWRRLAVWIAKNRHGSFLSVIVDDFDVVRLRIQPDKADPVLIVDPNAVLTLSASLQCFKMISGRLPQILQFPRIVENLKFAPRGDRDRTVATAFTIQEQPFGLFVLE